MRKIDLLKILSAALATSLLLSGCSLPFFKKESRVSPDKVYSACGEFDCEDYDDLSEMTDDLDNKRVLKAGLYITAEGKDIRHAMNDSDINVLFEDVTEELMYSLYSKSIDKLTLMMKSDENKEGGIIKIAVVAAEFEDEDAAWKYYKSCNDQFSDLIDEEEVDSAKDYLSDEDLECTVTQIFDGRSATCYSVYIDRNCVMVLTGYEYRCNDIDFELDDYCELLGIPAPDMSGWDCLAQPEVEDRSQLVLDEWDPTYIDPYDFEDNVDSTMRQMIYTETDDEDIMSDLVEFGEDMYDSVSMMRAIYNSGDNNRYEATYVISYTCESKEIAEALYEEFLDNIQEESGSHITDTDTGASGSITYTKIEISMYINAKYGVYLEDDMVYLIGTAALEDLASSARFDECTGIMGLP